MEVDDYLLWAARIDELNDSSDARAVLAAALHLELLNDPENFGTRYFETLNGLRDDPMRRLAVKLIGEGKTTFADARAALEQHNSTNQ